MVRALCVEKALCDGVHVCVAVCECVVYSALFLFFIILYVSCFGRTVLYMCIEYHI